MRRILYGYRQRREDGSPGPIAVASVIATVQDLDARGIGFRLLSENVDTLPSGGRLIFHLFASLAGLTAARARGRVGGRPPKISASKQQHAQTLYDSGQSISAICQTLGVSRPTLYRAITPQGGQHAPGS